MSYLIGRIVAGIVGLLALPLAAQDFHPMSDGSATIQVPVTCAPYVDPYGLTCHERVQYPGGSQLNSYRLKTQTFDSSWNTWLALNTASQEGAMEMMDKALLVTMSADAAFLQETLASTPVQVVRVDRANLPAKALSCYGLEFEVGMADFLQGMFDALSQLPGSEGLEKPHSLRRSEVCLWRTGFWNNVVKTEVEADFSFSQQYAQDQLPIIRAEIDRAFASLVLN